MLATKSAELVRRTRRSGEPIVVTQNGRAAAVLQDVESFERQRKALLLLRYVAIEADGDTAATVEANITGCTGTCPWPGCGTASPY